MKKKKPIRLPPKHDEHAGAYATRTAIQRLHGERWYQRFAEAFGVGTCPVVEGEGDACFYYHDYLRFADLIDSGKPTYFD